MNLRKGQILLLLLLCSLGSRADVLPNDAVIDGKTIPEWSAEWWKWVLGQPLESNPMLDTDGRFATNAQPPGAVFLVAGDLGLVPDTFHRSFSVPEGKYLFFPVSMYEGDDVNTVPPFSAGELRDQAAGVLAALISLSVSLDGVEVTNLAAHRAVSPVFDIFYTDTNNIHSYAYGQPVTGLLDPLISDGYWLMLEPLTAGEHVLKVDSSYNLPFFFGNHVEDHITVVAIPLSQSLSDLISQVRSSTLPGKLKQKLLDILQLAQKAFNHNQLKAGIAHLNNFQKQVGREVAPIDSSLAEALRLETQQIIERAQNVNGSRKKKQND